MFHFLSIISSLPHLETIKDKSCKILFYLLTTINLPIYFFIACHLSAYLLIACNLLAYPFTACSLPIYLPMTSIVLIESTFLVATRSILRAMIFRINLSVLLVYHTFSYVCVSLN